ncbi:tetratricopeptide repeat protein [Flavobacterium sp.]|uniref:tetratricopeptide repeat protein n=1 Tax=Flavobacterium sp. TaxID=239 RepID=UPI003753D2C4
MKKIILFLAIIISNNLYSQSLEEKVAIRACECLKNKTKVDGDIYQNCITKSMTDVVLTDSDTKNREVINTVDGIQSLFKKVYTIMPQTCENEKQKEINIKKNQFYSYSKNEKAKSSYIISKDFMRDEEYKLAIEGLEMAIKSDKNFVLAYDDIALCYRQLNDFDNAIKYYKKSLEIYPEGDFALMNIGVIYSKKSDFKTAIEYYEKLIRFHPKNAEGFFGAGKNYFLLNDYEKALNNIFIAHRIYSEDKSEYVKDTEQIMGMMYQKLKSENKEEVFNKIAEKNNIKIN